MKSVCMMVVHAMYIMYVECSNLEIKQEESFIKIYKNRVHVNVHKVWIRTIHS